jgi:hypothetical protein
VCVSVVFKKRAAARKVGDARRGPCRGLNENCVCALVGIKSEQQREK